jgi:hypothetical protein
MKNILAENMLRFGTKNLNESTRQTLTEQTDSGDPSQATIDLSAEYIAAREALQTYSATLKTLTGKDDSVFITTITQDQEPSATIIITSNKYKMMPTPTPNAPAYKFRYDISTGTAKTYRFFTDPSTNTGRAEAKPANLDVDGIAAGIVFWKTKKEKDQATLTAAKKTAAAAILPFFNAIATKVPKNYVADINATNGTSTFSLSKS